MSCGNLTPRQAFQEALAALNPSAAEYVEALSKAGHIGEGVRAQAERLDAKNKAQVYPVISCILLVLVSP